MPRYIDADDLAKVFMLKGKDKLRLATVINEIEMSPTADVVEVVRCRDCLFYRNHPNGLCCLWTEPDTSERGYKGDANCVEPNDFCSRAKRKDQP